MWLSDLAGRDAHVAESSSREGCPCGLAVYQGGMPMWLSDLAGRDAHVAESSSREGCPCG